MQGSRTKVTLMSQRIGQLEDALRISHALSSNDTHPLLSGKLLEIKDIGQFLGADTEVSAQPTTARTGDHNGESASLPTAHSSESDANSLIPALGRLFISNGGRSQYSGPSVWRPYVRLVALNAGRLGLTIYPRV
jgi:hypothetical protein